MKRLLIGLTAMCLLALPAIVGCGAKSVCEKQEPALAACMVTLHTTGDVAKCDKFNACLANCIINAPCEDFANGKVSVCQHGCTTD